MAPFSTLLEIASRKPFLAQRGARSDLAADGLARAACGGKCRVIDAADRRRSSSLRSSDEIA